MFKAKEIAIGGIVGLAVSLLILVLANPNVIVWTWVQFQRWTHVTNCTMIAPHAGERGYVWPDNRCHHIPPSAVGITTRSMGVPSKGRTYGI